MKSIELYCATANLCKQREFQRASGNGIIIHRLGKCNCPENGQSFEENARSKALCYSRALRLQNVSGNDSLVFADDSGLVVDALGGAPGIYSARFAGPDATDEANNHKLTTQLSGIPESKRTGRFVCSIVLVRGEKVLGNFHGITEGQILDFPKGGGGFGYDPLFFCPLLEKTFAEISTATKWKHSHRGKAFRTMLEMLRAGNSCEYLLPHP